MTSVAKIFLAEKIFATLTKYLFLIKNVVMKRCLTHFKQQPSAIYNTTETPAEKCKYFETLFRDRNLLSRFGTTKFGTEKSAEFKAIGKAIGRFDQKYTNYKTSNNHNINLIIHYYY